MNEPKKLLGLLFVYKDLSFTILFQFLSFKYVEVHNLYIINTRKYTLLHTRSIHIKKNRQNTDTTGRLISR